MTLESQLRADLFLQEGNQWLEAQDFQEAKICFETAARLKPENPEILVQLGTTLMQLGFQKQAWKIVNQALTIFQQTNRHNDTIQTLIHLGDLQMNSRNLEQARLYYIRAYKLARDSGKTDLVATCLNRIGEIDIDRNDFQQALKSLKLAVHIKKTCDNQNGLAHYYMDLAFAYERLSDVKQAQRYYEYILEISNELEADLAIRNVLPAALMGLGRLLELEDRFQEAASFYQMAVIAAEVNHDPELFFQALNHFSIAISCQNDHYPIYNSLNANRWLREELTEEQGRALSLLLHGVEIQQSETEINTINYYQQAISLFTKLKEWYGVAICHMYIGDCYYIKGEELRAMDAYQLAIKHAEQSGAIRIEAVCRLNLGDLTRGHENYDDAVYYYRTALKRYRELHEVEAVNECYQALTMCVGNLNPVEA